jgi:hypothetical protein
MLSRLVSAALLVLSLGAADALAQEEIELGLYGGGVLPTNDTGFSDLYLPSYSALVTVGVPVEFAGRMATFGLEVSIDTFPLDRDTYIERVEALPDALPVVRLDEGGATVFGVGVFGRIPFGDPFRSHPYVGAGANISTFTTKNIVIQRDGEFIQVIQGVGVSNVGTRAFAGYAFSLSESTQFVVEPGYHLVFSEDLVGYAALRVGLRYTP